MKPIFIISLPRSGSTLLQKILGASGQVSTHAEPWLLLPLLRSSSKYSGFTEYSQKFSSLAIREVIQNIGEEEYDECVRNFGMNIYQRLMDEDTMYFLDKTPRYYFILEELHRVFPEAKFIYLLRNPASVLNSILTSWCDNKFSNLHNFYNDFRIGPQNILKSLSERKDKVCVVKYEDIIGDTGNEVKKICSYLDIAFDIKMIDDFSHVNLKGKLGDQKINKTKQVGSEKDTRQATKWQANMNNLFRVKYLEKHFQTTWKGYENYGYNFAEMRQEMVVNYNPFNILKDIYGELVSRTIVRYKLNIIGKSALRSEFKNKGIY